ncbi:hypothetical protein BC829DRAFT_443307 [Chytridium lagenaria]|nr:hypothetical protein BC829DRAFT_443307 [Chytridium lagenaria]
MAPLLVHEPVRSRWHIMRFTISIPLSITFILTFIIQSAHGAMEYNNNDADATNPLPVFNSASAYVDVLGMVCLSTFVLALAVWALTEWGYFHHWALWFFVAMDWSFHYPSSLPVNTFTSHITARLTMYLEAHLIKKKSKDWDIRRVTEVDGVVGGEVEQVDERPDENGWEDADEIENGGRARSPVEMMEESGSISYKSRRKRTDEVNGSGIHVESPVGSATAGRTDHEVGSKGSGEGIVTALSASSDAGSIVDIIRAHQMSGKSNSSDVASVGQNDSQRNLGRKQSNRLGELVATTTSANTEVTSKSSLSTFERSEPNETPALRPPSGRGFFAARRQKRSRSREPGARNAGRGGGGLYLRENVALTPSLVNAAAQVRTFTSTATSMSSFADPLEGSNDLVGVPVRSVPGLGTGWIPPPAPGGPSFIDAAAQVRTFNSVTSGVEGNGERLENVVEDCAPMASMTRL